MALPRQARLTRSADVGRVLQTGRTRAGRLAALYWSLRDDADGPRAAFVVSRRTGPAVVRNRVRRRLAEALRHRLHRISPSADLVIVARRRATRASFPAVEQELEDLLEACGLMSPDTKPAGQAEQEDAP